MPKVPWADLAGDPAKAPLLAAELEESFFGGRSANDPFDSHRLREGVNLISRVCTRLRLGGLYSATTSRAGSGSLVLCVFESEEDRDRVGDLVEARASADGGDWSSRRQFSLTAAIHERLVSRFDSGLTVAIERNAAEQTLRWGDV